MGSLYDHLGTRLEAAAAILDVGSGRRPAIDPARRPAGCRYVGLDVSATELRLAPSGSYDETICGDLAQRHQSLVGKFDLIVSINVFEHVAELRVACSHLRAYLSEGGRMVAILSGRYSCFALANRALPHRLAQCIAALATRRAPETVFRAYYCDCYYDGLAKILSGWSKCEIYPQYRGEIYFRFSRAAHHSYLAYESWAYRTRKRNLATHYFIVAEP